MIEGHGDIASVLPDKEDLIFFASGVSNSQETRKEEYDREIDLLLSQDLGKHIVYFSSLSIFYSDTRYAQHKKAVEEIVKSFPHYTIIRLGNISWGTNPHTLINYFKNQINNGEGLQILDTYRYVISKEEFLHWINLIPEWNCEMNLSGEMLTVAEIVERIKDGYFG